LPPPVPPLPDVRPDRRSFLRLAAAALGGATLPAQWACTTERSGRRILHAALYGPPSTTDPAFGLGFADNCLDWLLYSGLTRYRTDGPEWGWQLLAARKVEPLDATHVGFELQPGLTFSGDYGEVTAEDFRFSIERVLDPAMRSPERAAWGPVSHVEVTGRYSGVIVLDEPFPALHLVALPDGSGSIVSRDAVSAMPGRRLRWEVPAASGPYQLGEWRQGHRLVLVRNPEWRGDRPAFDEIHILQIFAPSVLELGFESGDLDYTHVSASSYAPLRQRPIRGSSLELRRSLYYAWLGMNVEHPKLAKREVRQAIQYAVDVEAVVEAATFGTAEPATGIIAPGLIGHRPRSLVPPRGDVERTRALLRAAGVEGGLELTLDIESGPTWTAPAALVIQSCLARVGITVEIRAHESASMVTLGDESAGDRWRDLQLYLQRFSMLPDPFYATAWFTTNQVGIWNWERFSSAEFDDLHRRATVELDPVARDRMVRRAQDLMEESGAYRFLFHPTTSVIWRQGIRPALRPDGQPLLRHFEVA
jgi:peptide/nickel transport system substrate-binding protein